MLEAQIPKDIRKYETKLVGSFTLRQLICFIVGCLAAFLVYKLASALNLGEVKMFLTFLAAAPAIAFGWIKPYGMKLEDFARTALISNFLAPKERIYKTNNSMRVASVKLEKMSQKDYKKRMEKEKKLAKENDKYIAYN